MSIIYKQIVVLLRYIRLCKEYVQLTTTTLNKIKFQEKF